MSELAPAPFSLDAVGRPAPVADDLDSRCRRIADDIASLAVEAEHLWRDALPVGDLTFRLVEASHALHRAALALGEPQLIGVSG